MTRISFDTAESFEGWDKFPSFVTSMILEKGLKRVAEIGAGANPAICPEFAQENRLDYRAIDQDAEEVKKASVGNLTVFDVCEKGRRIPGGPYELICGRMAAEHFRDAEAAYDNMFHSLVPGGMLVQSFACLYSFPFLVNRLTPEPVADLLLSCLAPRDRVQHDKFKAFYQRCRGPIRSQLHFLEGIGFQILEYRTYFGHRYYERRLKTLHYLEKIKSQLLIRMPIPHLASYATIVLRRPT